MVHLRRHRIATLAVIAVKTAIMPLICCISMSRSTLGVVNAFHPQHRRQPAATSLIRLFASSSPSSGRPKVEISPTDHGTKPLTSFKISGEKDRRIQSVLQKQNWTKPTAIQAHAIPLIQEGLDVMASSQTGSGKSLMFCLPLVEKLLQTPKRFKPRTGGGSRAGATPLALIVSPTRELAIQTADVLKVLCKPLDLQVSLATGGNDLKEQRQQLTNSDILVGTPGRILQFSDERNLRLGGRRRDEGNNHLQYLVIDEADRLLDLGFEPQMTRISKLLPKQKKHQSILCSATFPRGVQRMAADFLSPNYYFISIGKVGSTEKNIDQQLEWIDSYGDARGNNSNKRQQDCIMRHIQTFLQKNSSKAGGEKNKEKKNGSQSSVLVFSNTKDGTDSLGRTLRARNIECGVIHGDKAQSERNRALQDFRDGKLQVLVATDVAARGLDISTVGLVVQAEAPRSLDTYTHRIGRTGRAGNKGTAVILLDGKSLGIATGLVELLQEANQDIPPWLRGMSYVSKARAMDEEDLISAGSGSNFMDNCSDGDEDVEINEKFTSQDFRRTATEGSYGIGRDVSYREFDDDAYRTDDTNGNTTEKFEMSDDEFEAESQSLSGDNSSDEEGIFEIPPSVTAVPSSSAAQVLAFDRPVPSAGLKRAIEENGGSVHFDEPNKSMLKALSRNQKLRFEYLGMFAFEQVVPLLMENQNAQKDGDSQSNSNESLPRVLMVAEKPSIAKAIADALSGKGGPRQRRGISRALPVYEFTSDAFVPVAGSAGNSGKEEVTAKRCVVTVTSVIGHVFSLSFDTPQGQQRNDPSDFFHLPVAKQEETSSSKVRVIDHLRALAGKSDHLVLWLDCDPEGENIAHEVIAVTRRAIEANSQGSVDSTDSRIHRAKFSAITPKALRDAFADLRKPDAALSRSVDARQELDLRVGVAFTRLLTWKTIGLARKRFDPATRVVSYGPCQTPALSFCVDRALKIQQFRPQDYWKVHVEVAAPERGNKTLPVTWVVPTGEAVEDARRVNVRRRQGDAAISYIDNATFGQVSAKKVVSAASDAGAYALATKIETKHETMSPPVGLNTVALLEAGSKAMGMSPKQVMNVAEKLYGAGFISYPRTETTKYDPSGFDVRSVLRDHSRHELWGKSCLYLLRKKYSTSGRPPSRGRDVGDHPPITPLKVANRQQVGGGAAWRVYEFVTRNFLGSLHDELSFTRRVISFDIDNDHGISLPSNSAHFMLEYVSVDSLGFADCCRWVLNDIGASKQRVESQFEKGEKYTIASATAERGQTRPPRFLQEHELILLMDENRIGTDASMAVHVNNIVERGYVQLCDETGVPIRPPRPPRPGQKPLPRQIGRYMVPTTLGMELLDLFGRFDEEEFSPTQAVPAMLSKPAIRRQMEEEVKQIAVGDLDKEECLERNLHWFESRYKELADTLTRDRINDFGSGLSQARDTLRYWRRLDAFEEATKRSNKNATPSGHTNQRSRGGHKKENGTSGRPKNRGGSKKSRQSLKGRNVNKSSRNKPKNGNGGLSRRQPAKKGSRHQAKV